MSKELNASQGFDNKEEFPVQPAALSPTVLEAEYEVVQELSSEAQVVRSGGQNKGDDV